MLNQKIGLALVVALAACGQAPEQRPDNATVTTSGKEPTALAAIPEQVLQAARVAQPSMTFTAAEAEVRDGRNYYDVAGTLPDGSEIELDLMQGPQGWSVVETQRDIAYGSVPEPVRAASANADPNFEPARVIESRQADGLIIYELFGAMPKDGGEPRKVEIKFNGTKAELLTKEWAH